MLSRLAAGAALSGVGASARLQERGAVFDVQTYCLYDGPGIRTCIFLQGCSLRCHWCHNPEGWEMPMSPPAASAQLAVRQLTVAELVEEVLPDQPFFDDSGGGVTFTGGEPTVQMQFLLCALQELAARGVHTAIETCGDFSESWIPPLVDCTGLFLYDLKTCDQERHQQATGVGNARILGNFSALLERVGPERVTPRIPVVPGFNADAQSAEALAEFLLAAGYRGGVHLMPYHAMARSKVERLGRGAAFVDCGPLSATALSTVGSAFAQVGLETQLFG